MKFDKFEIKRNKDSYEIILSELSQNTSETDITSIFWYPLLERDISEFNNNLKKNNFYNFPLDILTKNVILNGTHYWMDKALNWYAEIEFYDFLINKKLMETLRLEQNNLPQNFRQKIKSIIAKKNRFKANEIYEKNKSSRQNFIIELEKVDIPYKLLIDYNLIVVNSRKYIF